VAWLTFQLAGGDAIQIVGRSVTGLTPFGHALIGMLWVAILAPLGLVIFLNFRIDRLQASTARLLFFIYAGLIGLSLATVFMVFTATSITRVFFITAAAFGALSLYGYTTQRNLDAVGSFLVMGVIGLLIAMVVNIFLGSTMLQWLISVVGVG